ncbi:septum formation family protein [Jiangella sp. DSM 45060]|uniref:septum formation family protein n=1 Tax=Jiangella sp. DSM 45060 TaxID=1798224 RepID=UPI00087D6952|nr:septum formation family protein [Jiangella sp. DSM 45060]SDS76237.1 Septum formation [Jiangella sp. DSM 45060]
MASTSRVAMAASAAVAAVLLLAGCSDDGDEPKRDASGNVTESAGADVFDVQVGDCLGDFGDSEQVTDVSVVPCDQEHAQEIYATAEIADGELPSDDDLRAQAEETCTAEFETYVGLPYAESALDFTWLQPTAESWDQGDRELVCLVNDPAGPVTGSLQGANR